MSEEITDPMELHRRLRNFAIGSLRAPFDDAEDAASAGVLIAVREQRWDWAYLSRVTKNHLFANWRNRKTRNEDYQWTYIEGEDEPIEIQKACVPAHQELRMVAREVIDAIPHLPEFCRDPLYLAAQEYSVDEIASELCRLKKDVTWQLAYGRNLLRKRDLYNINPRGHAKYVGVSKRHRKWRAEIRLDGRSLFLGSFDTASQAAKAYDDAAKKYWGEKANLNFPEELVA